ncbi:sialate O-acetylesterase [Pontiellaceae bacterium B12219]|nr:sialate O-acetylesterase [Pontiellaceae bacterium B12219]
MNERKCKGSVLGIVLAGLLSVSHATAALRNDIQGFALPKVISSNMVLQRDRPVRLWGWAEPNQTVHVVLEREGNLFPAETLTDEDGCWEVSLPAQTVCTFPCSLSFETGDSSGSAVVLTNVLFGDVWLVSGQSNMEKKVGHLLEAAEIIERADQSDLIRSFRARHNVQNEPQQKVNPSTEPWIVVDSATVASHVSAVAYCFALKVIESTDIPLGLLQAYHGGSEIETWLSADRIQQDPDLSSVRKRDWKNPDRKAYAAHYSVNYNGQIHPLIRFPVKGILWCQGESNTKRALEYAVLQNALVQDWRQKWNCGELPFLFVQLFNMGVSENRLYEESHWSDLRDQQLSPKTQRPVR